MIFPGQSLFWAAVGWLGLAVGVVAFPQWSASWWWVGGGLGTLAFFDGMMLLAVKPPRMTRRLPGRFAHGREGEVAITLIGQRKGRPEFVKVYDGIPSGALAEAMPWAGELPYQREVTVKHPVVLGERGVAVFSAVQVIQRSGWGFWQRRKNLGETEKVKVYPDYEPVIRYSLLAMQHRESPLGVVRRPRPGSSRDFHQLRDYRDGDPFAQIDWKASSRRQALIARDYQEQRDQTVVFLLDTGRRMRAMDGGLPQFDHVLNAVFFVAHVALRQGDAVAVKTFGGTDRWLPPVKGAHAMPVLLNFLYDCQTTAEPSDFPLAVEQLMARQRRRSLVVVVTNLRGEDEKELLPAMQVLQRKHLVLVASMREEIVRTAVEKPVMVFDDAVRYLAADRYLQERNEVLAGLAASGVLTLDAAASDLAVELANRYEEIKATGAIS